MTNSGGGLARTALYHPFGEMAEEVTLDVATAPESKGWIGERYDAGASLQYLNARAYDAAQPHQTEL